MRSKLLVLGFVLVLSALVLGGCSPLSLKGRHSDGTPSAVSTPTLESPIAVPTAVSPLPTSTPEPTVALAPEVSEELEEEEGVRISYDYTLADDLLVETIPAEELMGGAGIMPEHVGLSFSGYVLPDTFHKPLIHIYAIRDLEAGSQAAANVVAALRQFLAEKPAAPEGIPFLPLFNAMQAMRAQVATIDFQNGTGVRFLAHYTQGLVPVNNNELFYTFQGISDDGAYYVAAILPVSHPALPADASVLIPDGEFETHMRDMEQLLNAQEASTFTPDLKVLDAMIRSLWLPPASGEEGTQGQIPTTPPSADAEGEQGDPYVGWARYVNPDYGFGFQYPSGWTLAEEPHIVRLSREGLMLTIGYRRDTEDELGSLGDLPEGGFENRGVVTVMGQTFPKSVLVYQGRDRVVLTGGAVDDLVFTIRLDDLGADDGTSAIPEAAQAELDQILGSFERVISQ